MRRKMLIRDGVISLIMGTMFSILMGLHEEAFMLVLSCLTFGFVSFIFVVGCNPAYEEKKGGKNESNR